jgi:8-oxo-dGTP pyrophosphatase MutT (NUDIX family)
MCATPFARGPWRVLSQTAAFENAWISVFDHDVIHPGGSRGNYGVVRFKNRAIGVLPVFDDGRVPLVGQHRFALDRYSWELPEGGGPLDEDPLAAAKRELKEETGLSAKSWTPLIEADLSNSVTDEAAVCFLAVDLQVGAAAPEPSESLQLRSIRFEELLNEVLSGKIRDSLTSLMTLAAYAKALQGAFPERISRLLTGGGR